MELNDISPGMGFAVLLTLSAMVIGLASLLLHLLFPPWRNISGKR